MSATRRIVSLVALLLVFLGVSPVVRGQDANDKPQKGHFALIHARVETVTNGIVENGTIVIDEGKIVAFGEGLAAPEGAEAIDCAGLTIYPGFIDGGTRLGLTEVGAVPVTNDSQELGDFIPHMRAISAVNASSELIKTARVSGVTTAITTPSGGLFPGTASLVNLVGYTPAHMAAGFEGVVVSFPSTGRRGRDRRSQEDIDKAAEKSLERLNEIWSKAKQFAAIDSARAVQASDHAAPANQEMEALLPVVRGERALMIEVNAAADILKAIEWVGKSKARTIFTGVAEGWRVADKIADAGIPCVVGPVMSTPTRDSDRYDKAYANAGLLHKAGVQVALRTSDASNVRNLPYQAGFAAAYGMGREAALEALTIVPARIFGVDDKLGSIEVGKSATLFVADNDAFEASTNVLHVFIDGYQIPMADRQVQLYHEFLERSPGFVK